MGMGSQKNNNLVSEINVTPLVDVMLVLLVIFMVTAPLMLNGISMKLPKTKENNRINLASTQVVLSYTLAGDFYLGKQKVLLEELIPFVKSQFKDQQTDVLFLRADSDLKYGKVARLMSYLKGQGIEKVALITDIEK
jgi:biopolymer transport protein TolR